MEFEQLSVERASRVLAELYGVPDAQISRLDTERDDSFHVQSPRGEYVLKAARPDDDPLHINLQTAALAFASEEPRLPLQSIVLSQGGEVEPLFDGRVTRLLTWLPGAPTSSTELDASQLEALGETLGLLNQALSTFDHPAAHREFEWDLAQLPLLRPVAEYYGYGEVLEVFDRYERLALDELPRQVVHNDFHRGNVLSLDGRISGVLDFGDVIHTLRIADVAIAQCYFGQHQELIDGFNRVVPLRDDELAVLPSLVAVRFAQRILINSRLGRENPGALGSIEANRSALRELLEQVS